MSRELIENLREYADIAEAGEKSHWAKAMREAAEYIVADLEKPLPERVKLDEKMLEHFTCEKEVQTFEGVKEPFVLYHTKMGAHQTYQLYKNEAAALWHNLGEALGYAEPPAWGYCPECGNTEFKIGIDLPGNEEKICTDCGQSWFADIDYSDVIKLNLKERVAIKTELAKPLPEPVGVVRAINPIARTAEFNFNTDLNGNISEWLKVGAKVYTRPQVAKPMTEEEFLNLKLPCDIKIGNGKNGKGTTIRTLLLRANNIYESAKLIKRNTLSCDEISAFCSDMPDELKIIFRMGVRFAEDRIHGIKEQE